MSATQGELSFGLDAPLAEVMSTMRAMRRLRPDPVPRELLEELVRAAGWAPSGGNAQGARWLIVTDHAQIAALAPIWSKALALYWKAVAVRGETMDESQYAALRRATEFQREHFAEIPALLVACHLSESPARRLRRNWRAMLPALVALGPRDAAAATLGARRAVAMAEAASVYPGVQNLLLSARALGLGATLTTLHLSFEAQFKRVLEIPAEFSTFAVVPVGYPRGRFGPVRRRPPAETVSWDRF